MEPKFKTIYNGELIECEISTAEGLVSRREGNIFNAIGWYREEYKSQVVGGLPLLRLYPCSGLKDSLKRDICCGHVITAGLFDLEAAVVWIPEKAGFYLDFKFDIEGVSSIKSFRAKGLDMSKSLITGHVDLVEVKK